jgi:LPXTG-motif cell wall-anchored protein
VEEGQRDLDAGEVVEERWATIVVAALAAGVLWWWRRRRRSSDQPDG